MESNRLDLYDVGSGRAAFRLVAALLCAGAFWLASACGSSSSGGSDTSDAKPDGTDGQPEDGRGVADAVYLGEARSDVLEVASDVFAQPVPDVEAAARAFKLYYRERVERTVITYNRFMVFGDVAFGSVIGKAGVSRTGDEWEIAAGPNDNNAIGVSVWTTWKAYKTFRTRPLALAAIRMFNGLSFYEEVSGHPGLTARNVYPGWVRTVDGVEGTVVRTRDGQEALPATQFAAPDLESEMLAALYGGFKATYREDPSDILLRYMPTAEIGPYCATYSFDMLPDFLRVSDCCASMKRTPAPYLWEGAYWSNHNSRDNFPDLSTGYVAAMEAKDDPLADAEVREAAKRAWEAGQRVGDLVQQNEGRLMTVDEFHPYDTLVVAGGVRPDGETESEDLGSLSDCQMAFLARAISSEGLAMPLPELPAPGSIEFLMEGLIDNCSVPVPVHMCARLGEAYCGKDWSNIGELLFMGKPWLELVAQLETDSPGTAKSLIGSFQDDFKEKALASMDLVYYARVKGDPALEAEAKKGLSEITSVMRFFGDLMYARTDPAGLVSQVYEAALLDAAAGVDVGLADLNGFTHAESHMQYIESLPLMADTLPAALKTDDEIKQIVEAELSGDSESVKKRYAEAYGEVPPLRRAGDGYEARTFHNGQLSEWLPVEKHHHNDVGGIHLLEALPICEGSPQLLDCTWAKLGCARPDLDGNGIVDAVDLAAFEKASTDYSATPCVGTNNWCGGADLDRTGTVDATDSAFMTAAQGCVR